MIKCYKSLKVWIATRERGVFVAKLNLQQIHKRATVVTSRKRAMANRCEIYTLECPTALHALRRRRLIPSKRYFLRQRPQKKSTASFEHASTIFNSPTFISKSINLFYIACMVNCDVIVFLVSVKIMIFF